jgi:hypothetical protein
MILFLFYAIPFFAGVAFLASLTAYLKPRAALYLRFLSLYLFIDCAVETYTSYQAYHGHNTQLVAGLSSAVFFCFVIYILRVITYGPKARRALLYCLFIFPLIFIANIFFFQKYVFQSMTYSLGCLLIVTACIYYFWELFQNKTYVNLIREPAFWICSGILFYCACSFPVYALLNFIGNVSPSFGRIIALIMDLVYIFLYLSFTIAFLCRLRPRKSML